MSEGRKNPLTEATRADPLSRAQQRLAELRDHCVANGAIDYAVPVIPKDPSLPGRHWLPEPQWISGWDAFEIFRMQTPPYETAPPLARICTTIVDQVDRDEVGLNHAFARLPPNHELLRDFPLGSIHWFRALKTVLTLDGTDEIDGWESFVADLNDWVAPWDNLRIRAYDVLENALTLDWAYHEYSLPEAKQEPVWSFPTAMAWIATRDYLALARMGYFRRAQGEDEPVATDGVCKYNTQALGWLHTATTYTHCECGALRDFGFAAFKHCTCISVAWEDLVRFNGGLSPSTPELVFGLQEGWLSMTWPDGADDIRFLRSDIQDRWPARSAARRETPAIEQSTAAGERDCREWLAQEFAADPAKRRSKRDFREAALARFAGRVSERGFNLRVWPELARDHGRDGAGAKRKS